MDEDDTIIDAYTIKAVNHYSNARYIQIHTFDNRTDSPQEGDTRTYSNLLPPEQVHGILLGCPDIYNPFYIRAVLREDVPEYYHPNDGIIQVTNWTGFQCGKMYSLVIGEDGLLDFYRGKQLEPPYTNRMEQVPVS